MDSDFGNVMASPPQSRNRLEDERGKDDEMSREVWKIVETDTGKIRVAEIEGGRDKEGSRKETRRKRGKEETKEGKNNGSKESSKGMGNMG